MEDKSAIACSIFFYSIEVIETSDIEVLNESTKKKFIKRQTN